MEFWLTAMVVVLTIAVALLVAWSPDRPLDLTEPSGTQSPELVVRPPHVSRPEFHYQPSSGKVVLNSLLATIARDQPLEATRQLGDAQKSGIVVWPPRASGADVEHRATARDRSIQPARHPADARIGRPPLRRQASALAICERCETPVGLPLKDSVTYCLGCRLFLCARCRTPDTPRCAECRVLTGSTRRGRVAGIAAARYAMAVLRQGILELSEMAMTDGASRSTRHAARSHTLAASDAGLAEIKIQAAAAAADHALQMTMARYEGEARALRHELTLMLAGADALREIAHLAASAQSAPTTDGAK